MRDNKNDLSAPPSARALVQASSGRGPLPASALVRQSTTQTSQVPFEQTRLMLSALNIGYGAGAPRWPHTSCAISMTQVVASAANPCVMTTALLADDEHGGCAAEGHAVASAGLEICAA